MAGDGAFCARYLNAADAFGLQLVNATDTTTAWASGSSQPRPAWFPQTQRHESMKSWLEPIPLVAVLRGRHPDEVVDIGSTLVVVGFRMLEVPIKSPRLFDNIRA